MLAALILASFVAPIPLRPASTDARTAIFVRPVSIPRSKDHFRTRTAQDEVSGGHVRTQIHPFWVIAIPMHVSKEVRGAISPQNR